MTQPPLGQCDTSSTFEIKDPTTEDIPQTEPSLSRGGTYNLRPNPNPNNSKLYRYCCVQNFFDAPFRVLLSFCKFLPEHHSFYFLFFGANPYKH